MRVEAKATVAAGAEEIFDYLGTPEFYRELEDILQNVSVAELVTVEEVEQDKVQRVARFRAPTRLPRFLKRFEGRAPGEVSWEDIGVFDRKANQMLFRIRPDVPDHWHELYKNSGVLTISPGKDGKSHVRFSIDFTVSSPGLGFLIERALRGEVEDVLKAQAEVLRRHFG